MGNYAGFVKNELKGVRGQMTPTSGGESMLAVKLNPIRKQDARPNAYRNPADQDEISNVVRVVRAVHPCTRSNREKKKE